MKNKKESQFSGFVNENNGTIVECFSHLKATKGQQVSGFCSKNIKEINTCYSLIDFHNCKHIAGFIYENHGNVYENFFSWLPGRQKNAKALEEDDFYIDYRYLEHDLAYANMPSWNFEEVWESGENSKDPFVPQFQNDIFFERVSEGKVISISTAEELFLLAQKVNNKEYIDPMSVFMLNNDIDLKGKNWTPIGMDENCAFQAVFNGNGYCISNFVISGKKQKYSGFFGYVKDAVIVNLDLDLRIIKGTVCAGLAVINNKSFISCCSVNASFHGCQIVGGFVNENYGEIKRCYCISKMKRVYVPPYKFLFFLFVLLLLLMVVLYYRNRIEYPKIPVDPNVISVEADQGNKGNEVTIKMKTDVEITGDAITIGFMNPGVSGKNIVVELQITDQELIAIKGSTGRTEEEQANLEAEEGYDATLTRTTIAKSGLVESGSELTSLERIPFADESELPAGTYNGIAYLKFYSRTTNEKAILDSQMPVKIIVK